MSDCDKALAVIDEVEGGYSDDANDPGGKTRWGITEAVARENGYAGQMNDLPKVLAETIYRQSYWDVCHCDEIPWPLNLYVFDAAVNQGVGAAARMLQIALGCGADGIIGKTTLVKAQGSSGWHRAKFMALRAMRYQATKNYDTFGLGWMTRLFQVAR